MPTLNEYTFQQTGFTLEKSGDKFIAGGKGTKQDLAAFKRFLRIDTADPRTEKELELYVIRVHQKILFYVNAIEKQKRVVMWYMISTSILAIAIPIFAFLIPLFHGKQIMDTPISLAAIISAQITMVLTGVFGLHKIVTQWVFGRNSIHAFWNASRQLKSVLYSLEDEWEGRLPQAPTPEFIQRLRESRKKAEDIVAEEEESFFKAYGRASVDLQGLIKSASIDAADVTGRISGGMIKSIEATEQKRAQQASELAKAREDVVRTRAQQRLLVEQIARLEHLAIGAAAATAKMLEAQLQAARTRLAAVEVELIQFTAALEAKKTAGTASL